MSDVTECPDTRKGNTQSQPSSLKRFNCLEGNFLKSAPDQTPQLEKTFPTFTKKANIPTYAPGRVPATLGSRAT